MEFLTEKRKFAAELHKFGPGWKKAKQDKETARFKAVKVIFYVKATKAVRETLGPEIVALMERGEGEGESLPDCLVSNLCVSKKIAAGVKFFKAGVWKDDAKCSVAIGFDGDGDATLELKKVLLVEEEWYLQVDLVCCFTTELWGWLGEHWLDGECVVESSPLQPELALEGEDPAAEESEEEDDTPLLDDAEAAEADHDLDLAAEEEEEAAEALDEDEGE